MEDIIISVEGNISLLCKHSRYSGRSEIIDRHFEVNLRHFEVTCHSQVTNPGRMSLRSVVTRRSDRMSRRREIPITIQQTKEAFDYVENVPYVGQEP